jgi:Raf kinase inhibitor-like YbhB/YbcL family protein
VLRTIRVMTFEPELKTIPRPFRISSRVRIVAAALGLAAALAACSSSPDSSSTTHATTPATTTASISAAVSGPNPYQYLPAVPSFQLTSTTVANGKPLPAAQLSKILGEPNGQDVSPELSWSGFPAATKSFVISMYDPQAPTGSGFWHWVVANIPVTTTSLPAGAGSAHPALPAGGFQLAGDAGARQYVGGAPPAGSGVHNYYITVTALDVATTGVTDTASAAYLGFSIDAHTIARATLVCPTSAS